MPRIHVAGHVCVDLVPTLNSAAVVRPGELTEVGPMAISLGGVVGNCGRVLAQLGAAVRLSACVGQDALGLLCRTSLEDRHPGRVHLTTAAGRSTSYSVVIQPPGTDRSFWHHTGANDAFDGEQCQLHDEQLLHLGYPTLMPALCTDHGSPIIRLFGRARAAGCATSLDLAFLAPNSPLRILDWGRLLANVLPWCDVFCPSWEDVASITGLPSAFQAGLVESWAQRFVDAGAAIVLITAGEHGAYLCSSSRVGLAHLATACPIDVPTWANQAGWIEPPAVEEIITTNAAGDTFKAAFLLGIARGGSVGQTAALARTAVADQLSGRPLNRVPPPVITRPTSSTGTP